MAALEIDEKTLPAKRRFTFPAFTNVWYILPAGKCSNYTKQWKLNKKGVHKHVGGTYMDVNALWTSWKKAVKHGKYYEIIKLYDAHNESEEKLDEYFDGKKWVFGEEEKESKDNKDDYNKQWLKIYTLSTAATTESIQEQKEEDDDDDDSDSDVGISLPTKSTKPTSNPTINPPPTPSLPQTPIAPTSSIRYRLRSNSHIPSLPIVTASGSAIFDESKGAVTVDATNPPQQLAIPDTNGYQQIYYHQSALQSLIIPTMRSLFNEQQQYIQQQFELIYDAQQQQKKSMQIFVRKQFKENGFTVHRKKKDIEKKVSKKTMDDRIRSLHDDINKKLDDKNVINLFDRVFNKNEIGMQLYSSKSKLIKNIKTKHLEELENEKNKLSKVYQDYYMMVKNKKSKRENDEMILMYTKTSEYEIKKDFVTKRKRTKKKKENVVDQFVKSREYGMISGYIYSLELYRDCCQYQRYWVEVDDDDHNEEVVLFCYKPLVELSQQYYYNMITHPSWIGATNGFHCEIYRKYIDKVLGRNIDGVDYIFDDGDAPPHCKVVETYIDDGDYTEIVFKMEKQQLIAHRMDAKGNVQHNVSGKFSHGNIVPNLMT